MSAPTRPCNLAAGLRACVVALGVWCLPAHAQIDETPSLRPAWYVAVQAYSFHEHTTQEDLRNDTPGIGMLRRDGNWLLGAGAFRNSIGNWAGYGYGGYQWPLGAIRVGGIAGATHRYNYNNGGIVPMAAAVVSVPLSDKWEIELIGIPRVKDYTYTTLNVSIAYRFR